MKWSKRLYSRPSSYCCRFSLSKHTLLKMIRSGILSGPDRCSPKPDLKDILEVIYSICGKYSRTPDNIEQSSLTTRILPSPSHLTPTLISFFLWLSDAIYVQAVWRRRLDSSVLVQLSCWFVPLIQPLIFPLKTALGVCIQWRKSTLCVVFWFSLIASKTLLIYSGMSYYLTIMST